MNMNMKKKSIYLTKTLQEIYDDKVRTRSFSGRVADITERYDILMRLTSAPELTAEERAIFREAIKGSLDTLKIRHLEDAVEDTQMAGAVELADKVRAMDYTQRMKLIEDTEYGC